MASSSYVGPLDLMGGTPSAYLFTAPLNGGSSAPLLPVYGERWNHWHRAPPAYDLLQPPQPPYQPPAMRRGAQRGSFFRGRTQNHRRPRSVAVFQHSDFFSQLQQSSHFNTTTTVNIVTLIDQSVIAQPGPRESWRYSLRSLPAPFHAASFLPASTLEADIPVDAIMCRYTIFAYPPLHSASLPNPRMFVSGSRSPRATHRPPDVKIGGVNNNLNATQLAQLIQRLAPSVNIQAVQLLPYSSGLCIVWVGEADGGTADLIDAIDGRVWMGPFGAVVCDVSRGIDVTILQAQLVSCRSLDATAAGNRHPSHITTAARWIPCPPSMAGCG